MKRRVFVAACALATLAGRASASPSPRVIVLSWDLAEMLLSLGLAPVGLPAPAWYTSGIVEPPLPLGVVDIGLLFQPNYDLLYELRPNLIVATPAHASVRASFEHIAPTLTLGEYMTAREPYRAMRGEALALGARIGRPAQAAALLDRTDAVIAQARDTLHGAHAPLIVAEAIDERHLRIYGAGSMFDEILQLLGLVNAATRAGLVTNRANVVEMERVAQMSDASLLWIGRDGSAALQRNPVWRQMPFAQPHRQATLPMISSTGALVSVQRFARALALAVPSLAAGHDM
ncbi:periplasmic binding protein [Caballeronia pedi]|uniref:Periplasmic binding protein n=1 Tax=Caballeronia pedi TaxID=1777141 RepID=A0A158B4R6_9BURK|nr:ABC transporter substrate-binding protein [Caballeronia pedi]SAK64327.1 periplasmic binding protein [Caballeronia pedi]